MKNEHLRPTPFESDRLDHIALVAGVQAGEVWIQSQLRNPGRTWIWIALEPPKKERTDWYFIVYRVFHLLRFQRSTTTHRRK